jgi:hypothetical protein
MMTLGRMMTPPPSQTLSPMVIGRAASSFAYRAAAAMG